MIAALRPYAYLMFICGLLPALVSGCAKSTSQIRPEALHKNLGFQSTVLNDRGIAFLTPATVTGQEQDRQALALILSEMMIALRPNVRVVSLPETLSAINRVGMAKEYRQMFDDYRESGMFARESLRRLGEACNARYLVQIKLSGFGRDMRDRFTLFGLRLLQTQYANIRLYLQIWDSETGSIVWEAMEELQYAFDSFAEQPVTFRAVAEVAARNIIKDLPN
jgi:hypothetical protein